jgi:hypothetical protein
VGEVLPPSTSGSLQSWIVMVAGIGQAVGIGIFFYNLLPRIRSSRKPE